MTFQFKHEACADVGSRSESLTGKNLEAAIDMLRRLKALRALGLKCRVRYAGIAWLLTMPPIGHDLARVALEILEQTDERRRFWPLMNLEMITRGVLAQCFPDAPQSSPVEAPEWLLACDIEGESQPMSPPEASKSKRGRSRKKGWSE